MVSPVYDDSKPTGEEESFCTGPSCKKSSGEALSNVVIDEDPKIPAWDSANQDGEKMPTFDDDSKKNKKDSKPESDAKPNKVQQLKDEILSSAGKKAEKLSKEIVAISKDVAEFEKKILRQAQKVDAKMDKPDAVARDIDTLKSLRARTKKFIKSLSKAFKNGKVSKSRADDDKAAARLILKKLQSVAKALGVLDEQSQEERNKSETF